MLYKDGRIKGVQDTLDGAVAAGLIINPWRVTALPTIPDTSAPFPGATLAIGGAIICAGASTQTLAGDTTLQTMVDVTGSGYIDFLAAQAVAATTGTLRTVLTIDGTVIADKTTISSAAAYRTLVLIGEYATAIEIMAGSSSPIHFRSSLKIQVQQSSSSINSRVYSRYFLAAPYTA
jgi:hypothetical protein